MRPRIQKGFGTITFKELNEFLNENNCWGITGKKVSPTVLEYMYVMMFRNLHESKHKLFLEHLNLLQVLKLKERNSTIFMDLRNTFLLNEKAYNSRKDK